MDLEITLIGAILLTLFVLPIIIVSRNSNGNEKETLKRLHTLALNNNCSISEFEILKHIIMGLDTKNRKLFFIRKKSIGFEEQVISLSEIKECQVLSKNKSKKEHGLSDKTVEKIELSFTYFDRKKPNSKVEIYNEDVDLFMAGNEFQFADKWKGNLDIIIAENAPRTKHTKAS